MTHVARRGVHRYEHRSKTGGRYGPAPVKIASHPDTAAYTHGKLGVLAHKQEVWCIGVGEVAELVVVEY